MAVKMGGWVQNLKFSGCMTVSGLCMHDFGARASAPWKIFCCLLKFLLKKCYKCRVGSEKSESRGVGWLIEPRSLLGGASKSPHARSAPADDGAHRPVSQPYMYHKYTQ